MKHVRLTSRLTLQQHLIPLLTICFFLFATIAVAQPQQGGGQSAQAGPGKGKQKANSVVQLLHKTTVPSTYHDIDPEETTVITGKQGTIVRIPAGTFVTASGLAVTGKVQVEMKEVFKKSDILLSNLPTISDGKMLESGGVVYLDAATMDGEKVVIAPGKAVTIDFPSGSPTQGMQAFSGQYDTEGNMNWTPMGAPAVAAGADNGIKADPNTLMFSDGEHSVKGYIYSILEGATQCVGTDKVWIEVGISPDGMTKRVRTSGYNSCYYKSVIDIVQNIKWDVDAAPGVDKISFTIEPQNYNNKENPRNGQYNAVASSDNMFAMYNEKFDKYEAKLQAREVANNSLQVAELGWINCDRFYEVTPKVNLMVNVDGGTEKEFARVFVVFKDIKSVMGGNQVDYSSHSFSNLPGGKKAYAVAISYLDNEPYFGMKEISISDQPIALSMNKTTIDGLKSKMESLN